MEEKQLQNNLTKTQLKNSIIKDFWNPFNFLKEKLKSDNPLYNELVLLGSRYDSLKKHFNSGIIYLNEYNVESNRIRSSFLELIDNSCYAVFEKRK